MWGYYAWCWWHCELYVPSELYAAYMKFNAIHTVLTRNYAPPFCRLQVFGGERERAYNWIQVVTFRAECNRTLVLQPSLVQGLYRYACNLICVCTQIGPTQSTNTSQSHLTSHHWLTHFTLTMYNGGRIFIHTLHVHVEHAYNDITLHNKVT